MEKTPQETLEEAAQKIISDMGWDWYETESSARRVAEYCAKQQAERMYSDAIEFGKWLDDNAQQREYYPMCAMTMEELFEQFKNK
jgi:hypothetical protein